MPWSCDMVVELPAPVGTADGAPASEEDDGAVPFDGAAAMGATATPETAAVRIPGRLWLGWSVPPLGVGGTADKCASAFPKQLFFRKELNARHQVITDYLGLLLGRVG